MAKNESGLQPIRKQAVKITQDGYEGRNWWDVYYGGVHVFVRAKTRVAAIWTAAKAFKKRPGEMEYYENAVAIKLRGEP